MPEGSLVFDSTAVGVHLINENYGNFFEKLFATLKVKGICSIDLAYGIGLTQADICDGADPQTFFKKLGIAISNDFKGTFDSKDISMVISNLVRKYGWHDCRIECRDFFIEQDHHEFFTVRQKPGKNLEWEKISKAINRVFNP